MSRLSQLLRYGSSVYHLPKLLKSIRDTRDRVRIQIPTCAVALAWILAFWARVRSREQIGRYLDRGAVQKLVGCHISSDTLGRVLSQLDADSLRTELLVPVIRQMQRNKAWCHGTVCGQTLIGIDGSEAFRSRHEHCPQCLSAQVEVQGEKLTEYHHNAVWAFLIGTEPRVYLDLELLRPGESEVTAATRLISRVAKHYGRWIDGVVLDAGFAGAPLLNLVRRLHLHYIVRVKQENRYLIQEAEEQFAQRAPDASWTQTIGHKRLQANAWDQDGFTSWGGLDAPARVVACDETELAEEPCRRRHVAQPQRQRSRAYLITSYPGKLFPTSAVSLAYHRRWHIENSGIRQLKDEWHWDHAFAHTSAACLEALWLLLAVAAALFLAFVGRRLLATRRGHTPRRTVAEEIAATLLLDTTLTSFWNSS